MFTKITKERMLPTAKFPRLVKGKETGLIAIALNEDTFVVLHQNGNEAWSVGEVGHRRVSEHFYDFTGTVELSND